MPLKNVLLISIVLITHLLEFMIKSQKCTLFEYIIQ